MLKKQCKIQRYTLVVNKFFFWRSLINYFCGGSIINENYVVTVAHCGRGQRIDAIQIVAGSVDLADPKSIHFVGKIIINERYNPSDTNGRNDIALIKVDAPFVVSETLTFAALPKPDQHIPAGAVAVVSGWGNLWFEGHSPRRLQRADIMIVDQDFCWRTYTDIGYTISNTQICAYKPNFVTGACHGDSGGPLTVGGKLVGLVSWSIKCANTKYPSVYTRVSEYIDWINTNAV